MRFTRFATAGMIAAAVLVLASERVHAQAMGVNCGALSGSPFICLKNESSVPITGIQAVAPGYGWYRPDGWIPISGGGVHPGGVVVVKMPTYSHGDVQNIVVRSADGKPHYFWNTNVRQVTSLLIRGF
jgi:hypothetical protein